MTEYILEMDEKWIKSSKDERGREFGEGFDCHPPGITTVKKCHKTLYFECKEGFHDLDGQRSAYDGRFVIKVYPVEQK